MSRTAAIHPLRLLLQVNLRQLLRRFQSTAVQSPLWVIMVVICTGGYLALSFWLFYRGLRFVETFPGLGALLTERLLFILFAFLFILLLLSSLVISYSNLFRNRETAFLVTLPISRETIFQWKFIESAFLASWAFVFLIAPLLAAYGLMRGVSWHFYVLTILLVGMFVVIPSVLGSWFAVVLARYLDRRSFQVSCVLIGLTLLSVVAFWPQPEPLTEEMLEVRVLAILDQMLMQTRFAQFPLLPSYWLSSSVLHWAEGAFATAGFFALVLLSNVLLFGFLCLTYTGHFFYDAASAVQSRNSVFGHWILGRRHKPSSSSPWPAKGGLEKVIGWLPWLEPDLAALIVKDIRIFWRDTTQWGQTLVLFGLLAAYIINLRHFSTQLTNAFWVNAVAFLNLGACSLNLATLTTRFVFPQFSLEGKRVWILGLAPLGLVRAVKTKFTLAFGASLIVTLGLILLSCRMLRLDFTRLSYFAVAITIMTFSLNGLAVGLGAIYPNFREENPSKIVSGFGGTFCLIVSFLYIVFSVAVLAYGSPWVASGARSVSVTLLCMGSFLGLSFLVGWVPFYWGLKKVANFEQT